ncbi:MAG: transposase [Saprospiraceae bacterium]
MDGKYQNKYRIAPSRAQWWDYGRNGAYFITICTKDRHYFFGEIADEKMILSPVGAIADVLWHQIPHHAPFVELGAFVVMPNHIHGILVLNKPPDDNGDNDGDIPPPETPGQKRFRNQGAETVSSIIGSYKSAVTRHANRLGLANGWQPRFDDRIIWDDEAYERVTQYIINNPKNWGKDRFRKKK